MSSARNHAKRSHRSEHFKKSDIGASVRKMHIRQAAKPQRTSFFNKMLQRLRLKKVEG